jgi:hypothetical protein
MALLVVASPLAYAGFGLPLPRIEAAGVRLRFGRRGVYRSQDAVQDTEVIKELNKIAEIDQT